MSLTLSDLTNAVTLELFGYTQTQEQASYLTAAITSSATSIPVADASKFSNGIVEIEDELVYVLTVDRSNNILTVAPFGRGYAGTTAVAHAINVKAVNSPLYPRSAIKRAINETVNALYPDLWTVALATQVIVAGQTGYTFNPTPQVGDVMDVTYQNPYSLEYAPIRRWKYDKYSNQIIIWDSLPTGYTARISYTSPPSVFASDATTIATTGLPESCSDVIRLGAIIRLLPYMEIPNSAILDADASFSANARISQTSAAALSRQLYQQFRIRVQEEAARLNQQYPVRVHYTR
jgi:hypothetical protein